MLIGATIPDHLPAPGAYALDGTAIESWARGRGRRKVDPNADHADDGAADTRPAVDDPSTATTATTATAATTAGTVVSFDVDAEYGHNDEDSLLQGGVIISPCH